MPTYVAFLRAINVTGRFVKMTALAEAFHAAGHADARTFLQSGNVVFTSSSRSPAKLQTALQDGLEPRLGFRSEAFVRTAAEVRAIAAHAIGLRGGVAAGGEVNVCLLPEAATPGITAAVAGLATDLDAFDVREREREVYWICRTRQSASTFSNATLERRLRVRTTLRRASMLARLAAEL